MGHFLDQFSLQITSVLLALLSGAVRYLFRPRSQLIYSSPHSFTFKLQHGEAPPFLVQTASVWVSNQGREASTEVELTFNYRPQNYNIWPPRPYETHDAKDGRHTLIFTNIAPQEFLQVELINSNQDLPIVASFRSKEGVARHIAMKPMRVFSRKVVYAYNGLAAIGLCTLIYVLLRIFWPLLSPFLNP